MSARNRKGKSQSSKIAQLTQFRASVAQSQRRLRITLEVPDITQSIPFGEIPEVVKRIIRKLTINKEADTIQDLYTSELSPLAKQITFSLGFALLLLGEGLLLRQPQFFGLFYASTLLPLLLSRIIKYSSNGEIFFLFELSTFNTLSLALNVLVLRKNEALWKTNFMLANGVVLW